MDMGGERQSIEARLSETVAADQIAALVAALPRALSCIRRWSRTNWHLGKDATTRRSITSGIPHLCTSRWSSCTGCLRRRAVGAGTDPGWKEMSSRPQADREWTHVLFAIQLRIGDRFTDLDGAWEIVGDPSIIHDGKTIEARVARPNDPRRIKHMTWATHERIPVRRSAGRHEPRG